MSERYFIDKYSDDFISVLDLKDNIYEEYYLTPDVIGVCDSDSNVFFGDDFYKVKCFIDNNPELCISRESDWKSLVHQRGTVKKVDNTTIRITDGYDSYIIYYVEERDFIIICKDGYVIVTLPKEGDFEYGIDIGSVESGSASFQITFKYVLYDCIHTVTLLNFYNSVFSFWKCNNILEMFKRANSMSLGETIKKGIDLGFYDKQIVNKFCESILESDISSIGLNNLTVLHNYYPNIIDSESIAIYSKKLFLKGR